LSVLADIALEAGRSSRAIHLLERSRTIEPTRARTRLELGKVKLKADDRAAAIAAFTEAIRLDAALAEAHYALIGELHRSGETTPAMIASEAALRSNPHNAGLHRQRGTLLQAAKRIDDAKVMFRRAVSLDAGDVKNVEALGNFYWSTKQIEPAVEQFERARALSRLAVKPRALLGGFYLEAGRMAEAERCIDEAYEIDPDTEGLGELRALFQVRQGNTRFRAGDTAGAEAAYRVALEARPDHEEALTNLVAVMQRTGRGNEAGVSLSRFIAQYPRATFAYSLSARVAAQNGNRAAALEFATRALALAREQKDPQQEQTIRALLQRLGGP
jgi:tetratricopeptide (TPR) repeat protein